MKRNPRKVRWTKSFRKAAGKEMAIVRLFAHTMNQRTDMKQDSTLEFENRRNVPVKYDRELMQATVAAVKRVGEIKSKREKAFWKDRYALPLI